LERRYILKLRELTVLLWLLLNLPCLSFEVLLNDESIRSWDGSLLQYCYDLPQGKAIPLLEILPPVVERDGCFLETERGRLSDVPMDSLLVWEEGDWFLHLEGEGVKILSVAVYGEPIDNDYLQVWLDWEGITALKESIQRFSSINGLRIETREVPKASSKLVSVVRARGEVPDVIMVQSSDISRLVYEEAIQSLDYIPVQGLSGLSSFNYEGRSWAIPFYFDCQLVFYNRGLVGEIDPGWTLEDLENLSKDPGSGGAGWNIYSAYWFIPFQLGFGKRDLIEDGRVTVLDGPTQEALGYLVERVDDGTFRALERDPMVTLFASGKVGIILSGSYMIEQFERIGMDFGLAPYPEPLRPVLDYKGLAITRKTRNPILARRLIEFLTSKYVQASFCKASYKIPSRREALDGMELNFAISSSLERGYPLPADPLYELYKDTMWKLIRLAISDRLGVREVLEKGQKIIDENSGGVQ
jgi:arabinogalactan oligomer/maltooligosaccharide transport system substrate-binding protein